MAEVQGIDALMRRMKAIGEPKPLLRALQLATIHEAQALVPRKTGLLQRRIIPGAITGDHAIVKADTPYAAPLEFGSKPHRIPKSGSARAPMPIGTVKRLSGRSSVRGGKVRLAPGYGKGGKPAFAMFVHHPGSKAYPYLIPGAKKATKGMTEVIVAQWNSAA